MQNTFDTIQAYNQQGISLSLYDGKLKAEPRALLTDEIRETIKANREVLVKALKDTLQNNAKFPPVDKKQAAIISGHRRDKKRPSPVALAWLLEHRQDLDAAGWTREELYTRKKYKLGLVWLPLWDEAFLLAFLHEDGTIEFECSIHGRDFFQTAQPIRKSISTSKNHPITRLKNDDSTTIDPVGERKRNSSFP